MEISICRDTFLRRIGPRDRPLLVFLHGFPDSGVMFLPLFETALAGDYQLLAVDLPGFGASPRRNGVGTIAEQAAALVELIAAAAPQGPLGLIGHSIASAIAVDAAPRLSSRLLGLISIEGNLTPDDAFFTGRAADYDDPETFKPAFLDMVWERAQSETILRRYHAAACLADPLAMWQLGRDAKHRSLDNRLGEAYRELDLPSLYYWSRDNTPAATADWIAGAGIANQEFSGASHWPTVDQPEATAAAIAAFFGGLS